MQENDSRGQESPDRRTASNATYIDDRLDAPWSRRSDCIDCGASNPADAPCCWRCGGTLAVDAGDDLRTDGGSADEFNWVEFDEPTYGHVDTSPPSLWRMFLPEVLSVAGWFSAAFSGMAIQKVAESDQLVRETAAGVTIVEGGGFPPAFAWAIGFGVLSLVLITAAVQAGGSR